MNWFTGILVYVMIWWVTFFAVLPWGVKPPAAPEPGHEPSAPDKPMLWRKALATSVIAAALWGIVYLGVEQKWINFRPE